MASRANDRLSKIGGKILTGKGQKKQGHTALQATVKAGGHHFAKS